MGENSSEFVQACITHVSFPKPHDLESLKGMIYKNNEYNIPFKTDMDFLLNFEAIKNKINNPEWFHYWSAPKWLTKGDILFFFNTVNSLTSAKSMLKNNYIEDVELKKTIEHAIELGSQYSGTIFGYAEVIDTSKRLSDEREKQHFKGKVFAPFNNVHIFEEPLEHEIFKQFVKIVRGGAYTPISNKNEFKKIKSLLGDKNKLPSYLKQANLSDIGFENVNENNWFDISCSDKVSYIHEIQIRAYLIDFLLKEIKDYRTPLLEECNCYKGDNSSGIVDYFMKIDSKWVPVEAKLNTLAERDLVSQIEKYIGIDYFIPTKYPNKGKIYNVACSGLCIIIDKLGMYLYKNHEFVDCEPGIPLWGKKEFKNSKKIREELINFF